MIAFYRRVCHRFYGSRNVFFSIEGSRARLLSDPILDSNESATMVLEIATQHRFDLFSWEQYGDNPTAIYDLLDPSRSLVYQTL